MEVLVLFVTMLAIIITGVLAFAALMGAIGMANGPIDKDDNG